MGDFNLMDFEILRHSGPARLGIFRIDSQVVTTPNFFSIVTPRIKIEHDIYLALESTKTDIRPLIVHYDTPKEGGIPPDLHVGFDVPYEIAKLAVEETIKKVRNLKSPAGGGVIQGSKYLDLRITCARALKDLPLLVIANGKELIRNPRLLVEIVTSIRENISPNTALYLPSAPPFMFYILSYMGIDFFDIVDCIEKARENIILTDRGYIGLSQLKELPCVCPTCRDRSPTDLIGDFKSILDHDYNISLQIMREIRETIRNNTLREIVEEKASADTNSMAILRILDLEKQDFIEKYTPIF
jgi:queuine/archaeosine tRNA-ribosyltransferase